MHEILKNRRIFVSIKQAHKCAHKDIYNTLIILSLWPGVYNDSDILDLEPFTWAPNAKTRRNPSGTYSYTHWAAKWTVGSCSAPTKTVVLTQIVSPDILFTVIPISLHRNAAVDTY